MLNLHLDSYQAKVFKEMDDHDMILVRGGKNAGKSHLLRTVCAHQLKQGKKILFATKDKQSVQESIQKMQLFSFKSECLALSPGRNLDAENLNRIRHLLKAEPKMFDQETARQVELNGIFLQDKVSSFYEGLNQDTLYDKKWHELVVLKSFDKNAFPTLHFNQLIKTAYFTFDKEEFSILFSEVQKAAEFHKEGRIFSESIFTGKNYEAESKELAWKRILTWLAEAKKKISHSLMSIIVYLNDETRVRKDRFIVALGDIKRATDKLLAKLQHESVTRYYSEYLELIKEIKRCEQYIQYFPGPEALSNRSSAEEFSQQLTQWRNNLSQVNDSLDNYIRRQISGISMHESSAPSLAKIDRELTGIYQWLNEQSLFNQRFERTALSINKQLLQLEELLVRFNEWQNLGPRFLHFYEWNKFIRSQDDKARHLLTKMAILQPKDWLTFFRNWYIQNSILHASDPYNVQVEKEVHELLLLEKEMQNTGIDKYHYTKSENKQMVLKKLKEKDRGLHRDLIRKSHPLDLPFDHLLSEHFDLISYIFPVHFISFEDLKGMKDRSKLKYDLLIVDAEDWHKNNLDINLDFLALGKKVIFADTAGQPFTLYCQEKKCAPAIFDLKGYHLQNIIDLKDMLPTERLYAARHLAHLLEDLHGDITIYHLGTNILYSCFSDPLNIVFEKLMESRGLKKIRVLEKKIHTLVENILEVNAEHKIMTQDLMINSAKQDMLPWQWQVKAKMERAGMDIINFNTHDLLEDSLPAMLQFLADNFPEKNKA